MRLVIGIVLFLASAAGMACGRASTAWIGTFANEARALAALRARIVERSARLDQEYGGALVPIRDGIAVTQSAGCRGGHSVDIVVPKGASALWHTHGRPSVTSQLFSPGDLEVARSTGLPFYLVLPDQVRVLDPGAGLVKRRVRRSLTRVAGHRGRPYAITTSG